MKRHKVLLFVLAVVAAYLLVWWLCPLPEMNLTLRLPSKTRYDLSHQKDTVQVADTVSVAEDTLPAGFLTLPDKTYFDKLFAEMSVARDSGTIVRILQYGDSQLEADRVSSTLRERLQEHFGGSGPGMVTPAPGNGTAAVNNYKSGGISRLTMYGEGSRAGHRRYGILCQLGQLSGSGTLFFKQTKNKHARPGVQHFSRVGLLVGNTGADFKATLYADTTRIRTITLDSAKTAVSYLTWTVPHEFSEGKIALSGRGELYGLAIDGASGVAVDNDGLRSCSGYIFTQIDTTVMQ